MGSTRAVSTDAVQPAAEERLGRAPLALGASAVQGLQRVAGNKAVGRALRRRSEAFARATSGQPAELPRRREMEAAFGTSFGDVRAYLGGPAVEAGLEALGAQAAARGAEVAFRDASPPDELVAHELAHVVQQRRGARGVARDTGPSWRAERAARQAGEAVAAGRPVSDVGVAAPGEIQLAEVRTAGGVWTTPPLTSTSKKFPNHPNYTVDTYGGSEIYAHFRVEFMQDPDITGRVGLVQSVKTDVTVGNTTRSDPPSNDTIRSVQLPEGSLDPGRAIDQSESSSSLIPSTSPFFASFNEKDKISTALGKEYLDPAKGQHGFRKGGPGTPDKQQAWIEDHPNRGTAGGKEYRQLFEVAALMIDGPLEGLYLGSIEWGWTNKGGKARMDPPQIRVVREGTPSAEFMDAARQWNNATIKGPRVVVELPTVDLPLDDFDPRRLSVAELTPKVAEARAAAADGPGQAFKAKVLERELASRQVPIKPGEQLAEIDAGPWTLGEVLTAWDYHSLHRTLDAAKSAIAADPGGHGGVIVERPKDWFHVVKTNPLSKEDNLKETTIDEDDSTNMVLVARKDAFHSAWLVLSDAAGKKRAPYKVI